MMKRIDALKQTREFVDNVWIKTPGKDQLVHIDDLLELYTWLDETVENDVGIGKYA